MDRNGNEHIRPGAPGGAGGQFAAKFSSPPDQSLPAMDDDPPTVETEGMGVQVGDIVRLDFEEPNGPFAFWFKRNLKLRMAWVDAGKPAFAEVTGRKREFSDVELTVNLGGQLHPIHMHEQNSVAIVDR